MKKIYVESIGQFIDCIFNLDGNNKNLNYIFRGQKSEKYSLISSLRRNYADKADYAEKRLLENFKKYGVSIESQIGDSIWKDIILAQHHGIPTRFLDFSYSPLIALHFALTDNVLNENAVVWAINIEIMHGELLPEKYKDVLRKHQAYSFTIDMLEELNVSVQSYNKDMKDKGILFLEPPSIDSRIINQSSVFAIMPDVLDPLDDFLEKSIFENIAYKFIIPYDNILIFRKQLDYLDINERILFPGLDGLSSYLKRRYIEN